MLAVAVSPHGFTTALASEASIVPRASHREITLAACLGRVLGAEPQVGCCWFNSHSYSYSLVSHTPLRTGRTNFLVSGSPAIPRSHSFLLQLLGCFVHLCLRGLHNGMFYIPPEFSCSGCSWQVQIRCFGLTFDLALTGLLRRFALRIPP